MVAGYGTESSYLDMKLSGLFNLDEGDDIFVTADDATNILRFVVCNYFGIYRVPHYKNQHRNTTTIPWMAWKQEAQGTLSRSPEKHVWNVHLYKIIFIICRLYDN